MSHTHSQVITLTGTRQSGVTTSLLEHVEKSLKSNPGKIALILAYNVNMVEMLYETINKSFPTIRDSVIVNLPPTFVQLISILNNPPEAGYCGVFADNGYRYLSHEGLMSIAREFPLLDIVVGDSKGSTPSAPDKTDDLSTTQLAFQNFKSTLQNDPSYAWSWQCNLVMLIRDGNEGVSHRDANISAAQFMNNVFGVNVTGSKAWHQFEEEWEAQSKATHYVLSRAGELSLVCTNGIVRDLGLTTDKFKMFALVYLKGASLERDSEEAFQYLDNTTPIIPLSVFPVLMFKWEEQYGNESIYR